MHKADSVRARFGGKDITFRIARADLESLERYTGIRSFALLTDFLGKSWGATDVARVLRFATLNKTACAMLRRSRISPDGIVASPHVDTTLATRPVGEYVPLAAAILTAALFGIEAADANFSDEADG